MLMELIKKIQHFAFHKLPIEMSKSHQKTIRTWSFVTIQLQQHIPDFFLCENPL